MRVANKVIFNTGVLYIRLILGIIIGFYTTRLVLDALGETDYGIYALVAGVIGMLAFLNASMSGVSVRFIAISLGSFDNLKINKTFNSTLLIHIFIGTFLAVIMIIAGLFLFDGVLNIPDDRVYAAKVIYYLMIISTFVTIISVPYNALISAHEEFTAISIIELFGLLLNLSIALYITSLKSNQLITYGILITANRILIRIIMQIYSRIQFKTIKVSILKYANKKEFKEIMSFTGWKTLDSSSAVVYGQLQGVLINLFFGVTLNAANGIAKQVSAQLQNLSASMLLAINPQIIKSEGGGNRRRMLELTSTSAKFSFFIMSFLALPIIIEAPLILNLWLKDLPEYTVLFCRLILIDMIISKYTFPINTAIAAVGQVKEIVIVVFINRVLQFSCAYLLFSMGFPPQSIYFVAISFSIIAIFYKLYFGKKIAGLDIGKYFINVFIRGSLPILITAIFAFIPALYLEQSILRLILTFSTSAIISSILIYWIGFSASEKAFFKNTISTIFRKVRPYLVSLNN